MKTRILLTVFFLASAVPVYAESGIYLQPEVAFSRIKIESDKNLEYSKDSFSPRITAGYDFGNNFRIGVDYTHYRPLNFSDSGTFNYRIKKLKTTIKLKYQDEGKVGFKSFGISTIYDFPASERVKPYLGVRVGFNRIEVDVKKTFPQVGRTKFFHKEKDGVGAGVLAGVGFKINEKITLDAGYRYNYWGKFQDVKLHRNEFATGLRIKF
ncbi:opacity family porin [Neisseria animaloris]|uniref:Opacity porin family protein n=1 Tax=Neisseria animaloris TaxID=326522 RepID=A0A3S5F6J8_9NEIS|nr:opacity family porin [Neisseria animaloris]VEJ21493.1 opacity porin family protein [Neisseria animaloris]